MSRNRFGVVTAVSAEVGMAMAALLFVRDPQRWADGEKLGPSEDLEYPVSMRLFLSFCESLDGSFRCHGRPPRMPVHVVGDGNGAADQSCRQIVRLSRRPGHFGYATRRISPTRAPR